MDKLEGTNKELFKEYLLLTKAIYAYKCKNRIILVNQFSEDICFHRGSIYKVYDYFISSSSDLAREFDDANIVCEDNQIEEIYKEITSFIKDK
jgi:hypothetical protein